MSFHWIYYYMRLKHMHDTHTKCHKYDNVKSNTIHITSLTRHTRNQREIEATYCLRRCINTLLLILLYTFSYLLYCYTYNINIFYIWTIIVVCILCQWLLLATHWLLFPRHAMAKAIATFHCDHLVNWCCHRCSSRSLAKWLNTCDTCVRCVPRFTSTIDRRD